MLETIGVTPEVFSYFLLILYGAMGFCTVRIYRKATTYIRLALFMDQFLKMIIENDRNKTYQDTPHNMAVTIHNEMNSYFHNETTKQYYRPMRERIIVPVVDVMCIAMVIFGIVKICFIGF